MLAQMTSAGRLEYHICDADFAGGFGCRHFLCVSLLLIFRHTVRTKKEIGKIIWKKQNTKKDTKTDITTEAKDCQKLYGKILDYVCSMFQEQEKKKECKERMDRCKERRKTIEKIMSGRPV